MVTAPAVSHRKSEDDRTDQSGTIRLYLSAAGGPR